MEFEWQSWHSIIISDEDFNLMATKYLDRNNYTDLDEMTLDAVRSWALGLDDVDYYTIPPRVLREIANVLKTIIREEK